MIKGIGAIMTDDEGRVVANAFDFDMSGFGGFKLWEAQRHRCKRAVIFKYIQAFCYGSMASVIDDYIADRIVEAMRQKKKLHLTFVAVGHEIEDIELNR